MLSAMSYIEGEMGGCLLLKTSAAPREQIAQCGSDFRVDTRSSDQGVVSDPLANDNEKRRVSRAPVATNTRSERTRVPGRKALVKYFSLVLRTSTIGITSTRQPSRLLTFRMQ